MELKIEYLDVKELKPYENNARKHGSVDVEGIKASIKEFGFNDPIGIWKDNIIIEGHGRLLAAQSLGMDKVPVIRLDELTDEQRRAYTLAHNKTAELSEWDFDVLEKELANIEIDMTDFGFLKEIEEAEEEYDSSKDGTYTQKTEVPQYEVTGEVPKLNECIEIDKYNQLIEKINASNVSKDEKAFLLHAAARHLAFDYAKVAEYYAAASEEMQSLMEESALVIIDFEDAIKNGYVVLNKRIAEMIENGKE